ncbi:MAG: glycine cleavage system protein H [Nitrospirae bacterium CG18_big_fil_WC_8_21_14_2_50_70_55]|nr:glycine cleavage system protein GcvH [Deltaproteobacteria bacterium]PIQ07090.1 MAG: glycine cleavage system protein H [Nitrospirae bacterium CG18_big_fil_WC_8_21_14_2_50_70_55]PIU79594.1 MAG: glycine cleavage system protein H [Nitrospirae bacterium CG06_land_8_20_14_3_00_70_43]PIW82141.1 MAG: glycine cleavage system protein H [Nitrospirae bacterium CG_4_8_14_3_um_filter_70_85]PJB96753.1 MAG: glycine cleavage system protein H [Nitrospirae bacterium CG_4_9_14_0_8_um_filter_70_14]
MNVPEGIKFTKEHEWCRKEDDGTVTVGITDYAQHALGDVVYVELPKVGDEYESGGELAELESTKATAPVYSPVTGKVVAVNEQVEQRPEVVNTSPYAEGWLVRMEMAVPSQYSKLLTAESYRDHLESAEG